MDIFDYCGYKVCVYTDDGENYHWDAYKYSSDKHFFSSAVFKDYTGAQLNAKVELGE